MSSKLERVMADNGWMTVAEVAELVGVTTQTVYKWIKARSVESTRVAGHQYVRTRSLAGHLGAVASEALGLSVD